MDESKSNDFSEIVGVTEKVKQILNISNEVTLKALNSMLIARRSGESARGFQVVSGELRNFSRRLEASMSEIMGPVSSLVVNVAESRRHFRRMAYFQKLDLRDDAAALVHDVIRGQGEENLNNRKKYIDQREKLLSRLEKARRVCAAGSSVSRAARIEAVHGGAYAKQLMQVATEVEITVGRIEDAIRTLERSFGRAN